jgi:hypothetical protein
MGITRMADKMTILGKDGRIRYIIEDELITDVLNCPHRFEDGDSPCIYCNLYPDELEPELKEN